MGWLFVWMTGCGVALGSDVWLDVEHTDGSERIALHLPANWIGQESDATVRTTDGEVDLDAEVRALRAKRPGASRTYQVLEDDGDIVPLTLRTEKGTGSASQVQVAALGPLGNGLTMSFALGDSAAASQATSQLDAAVEVDGLQLKVEEPFVAQLRTSGPAVLLRSTGPKGGGLVIETR
jgi:hypothetical protein